MFSAELMHDRITGLERANEVATKRRQCKKKRILKRRTFTRVEGEDILAQREADQQIEREQRQGGEQSSFCRQALARYTRCREAEHNSRTCKNDSLNTTSSILLTDLYIFLTWLRCKLKERRRVAGVRRSLATYIK